MGVEEPVAIPEPAELIFQHSGEGLAEEAVAICVLQEATCKEVNVPGMLVQHLERCPVSGGDVIGPLVPAVDPVLWAVELLVEGRVPGEPVVASTLEIP